MLPCVNFAVMVISIVGLKSLPSPELERTLLGAFIEQGSNRGYFERVSGTCIWMMATDGLYSLPVLS